MAKDYWSKRMLEALYRAEQQGFHMEVNLLRQFQEAKKSIKSAIEELLTDKSGSLITEDEALKKYNEDLEFLFPQDVERLFPGYTKVRAGRNYYLVKNDQYIPISRKVILDKQLEYTIDKLRDYQDRKLNEVLGSVYEDTYYHALFDVQQDAGVGFGFARLDAEAIKVAVGTKWCQGENYSDRIWHNKAVLERKLTKTIQQGIIKGEDIKSMVATIEHDMNVQYHNAQRLVRTEVNHIYNQAANDSYQQGGIEKYRYVAVLDNKTSKICRETDGKTFNVSDYQPGVNAPPLHPNCRCTTIPVVEWNSIETRAARDLITGKTISVKDMDYEEWHKKYVSPPKATTNEEWVEQIRNIGSTQDVDREILTSQANSSLDVWRKAVSEYTGDKFADLNSRLYRLQGDTDFESVSRFSSPDANKRYAEESKELDDTLQKMFKNASLSQETVVYRKVSIEKMARALDCGMTRDDILEAVNEVIDDEYIITQWGYTSTSLDRDVYVEMINPVEAVRLNFLAPAGSKAVYVASQSIYSSEQEMLFNRGTKYRIVGYNDSEQVLDIFAVLLT